MKSNYLYSKTGDRHSIIFILSAGIVLLLLLYRILLIFSYNGELAGIDNNFVYDVSRSIAGSGPYTNPEAAPYAITLYAPLYFTACSFIGKLLHIDPDNAISVYQLCRSISLMADIITCIFLYLILRKRYNTDKRLAWLALAAFTCIICKLGYTFSRSDSFLLAFYAAILYILTSNTQKRVRKTLLLSLFSIGCIFSKQNGIIVPVAVAAWLFLSHERKAALHYLILSLFAGAVLVITYRSVYPNLFLNTVSALNNRIDLSWFYSDIFKRSMDSLWILPLYFAALTSIRRWRKPEQSEDKAIAAMFVIQVLFDLIISLKWGSSVSYFNESFFLAFVILFRQTTKQQQTVSDPWPKRATVILPLLVLFFVHTVTEGYLFFLQNRDNKKALYSQQREIRDYLRPKLKGQYVMNLTEPNTNFLKTLFYKEIAVPNMDMVDCCTLPDQTFNYASLKQDLTNGKIAFLVMAENERLDELWNVSLRGYAKDTNLYGFSIYAFIPVADNSH